MSHVTSVNFHYDRNAPVKSKKLFKMKSLLALIRKVIFKIKKRERINF